MSQTLLEVIEEYKLVNNIEDPEKQQHASICYNTIFQYMLTNDSHNLLKMARIHKLKITVCENNYLIMTPLQGSVLCNAIVLNMNPDCKKIIIEVPHLAIEDIAYSANYYFKEGNCKLMILSSQIPEEPRLEKDICYKKSSQFTDLNNLMSVLLSDHVIIQLHVDNYCESDLVISNGYGKLATLSVPKMLSNHLSMRRVDHILDDKCSNINTVSRLFNNEEDSGRFAMIVQGPKFNAHSTFIQNFGQLFVPLNMGQYKEIPPLVYNNEAPKPIDHAEVKRKEEEARKLEEKVTEAKRGPRKKTVKIVEDVTKVTQEVIKIIEEIKEPVPVVVEPVVETKEIDDVISDETEEEEYEEEEVSE